jgi:non-lysosomal glucosylceramidase
MHIGKIDRTCLQSREVWTGTTYAVAAAMYQLGLQKESFKTANGSYD